MALDDIVFQGGDKQNFVNEIPVGTLNTPVDISFGSKTISRIPPLIEIPAKEIFFSFSA